MLQAPKTNLKIGREVSYNHDKKFNKLKRGISTTVYIYKTKHHGANAHASLNGSATYLALGSLVLKIRAQDIPWWIFVNLVQTIYLPVGSATCHFSFWGICIHSVLKGTFLHGLISSNKVFVPSVSSPPPRPPLSW